MNRSLVPFVCWCAAAIFLVCAFPLSPPGEVPGLSAYRLANGLFIVTTIWLIAQAFSFGRSCRKCGKRERLFKRLSYTWLCVIILFAYFAVVDIVSRGTIYISMPLLVAYGLVLFFLLGVFFILRYWKIRSGRADL